MAGSVVKGLARAARLMTFCDHLGAADVMPVVKLPNGVGLGLLEGFEGRPLLQKVGGQAAGQVAAQRLDGLGKILLETGQQGLHMAGALVHDLASVFDQAAQQPGFLGVGAQRAQLVQVLGEDLQDWSVSSGSFLAPLDLKASRNLATVVG